MLVLVLTFALALAVSTAGTYWGRGLGRRVGMVDHPDEFRRRHDRPIPRVGGVAIFLGALAAMAVPLLVQRGGSILTGALETALLPLLLASAAIFLLGLVDDLWNLRARYKLLAEILVSGALWFSGLGIGSLAMGGTVLLTLPAGVDLLLTVFWFVGLANAFNLIDGHDGVAGGVALLALATISYAAVLNGNSLVAIPTLALSGAVLGFLLFNLPPASVFMGDAGSLFLGFALAGLGLLAVRGGPGGAVPVLVPVMALGLPVLDTSLAISRRLLRGDPVFHPDRGHIHHRLHDMGYPRTVVTLLMWGLAGIFSLVAVMLLGQDALLATVGLVLAVTVSLIAVRWLETPELMEVGRAVQRIFVQRRTIRENVRLRSAVALLAEAESPEKLHDALNHAFLDSHCNHIRVQIPLAWVPALADHAAFRAGEEGVSWEAGEAGTPAAWEVRLRLELATPDDGLMILRHGDRRSDSLAYVDSIVRKVAPELCRALDRMLPGEGQAPATRSTDPGRDNRGPGATP